MGTVGGMGRQGGVAGTCRPMSRPTLHKCCTTAPPQGPGAGGTLRGAARRAGGVRTWTPAAAVGAGIVRTWAPRAQGPTAVPLYHPAGDTGAIGIAAAGGGRHDVMELDVPFICTCSSIETVDPNFQGWFMGLPRIGRCSMRSDHICGST